MPFGKVFQKFDMHIQLDFVVISKLTKLPIPHMVDTSTSFSATTISPNRNIESVGMLLELHWINIHGAPQKISGVLSS